MELSLASDSQVLVTLHCGPKIPSRLMPRARMVTARRYSSGYSQSLPRWNRMKCTSSRRATALIMATSRTSPLASTYTF
jgi:hypothetical protein